MKAKIILFIAAMSVVQAGMAQSNPNSTNSQNTAGIAINSGEYVESYHRSYNHMVDFGGSDFVDNYWFDWVDNSNAVFSELYLDGDLYSETNSTFWPQAKSPGTNVDIVNGSLYSSGTVPPLDPTTFSYEHCDADFNMTYHWYPNTVVETYHRNEDTKLTLATGGTPGSTKMNLWMVSATATTNTFGVLGGGTFPDDSPAEWSGGEVPFQQIRVGVFGQLDAGGHAYMLLPDNTNVDVTPYVAGLDHYTFTEPPTPVTLTQLTVVSNATQIDATNWACVKMTNDYVYVKATLSDMSDTNSANQIQWSVGDKVSYDPFQVKVSKAASQMIPVTATVGSTSSNLNVWVIWATVSIQTSSNNPSPLTFPTALPGNTLGIQYYTWDLNFNDVATLLTNGSSATAAVGKMCGVALITPAGVHQIISNDFGFIQMKMLHPFANGSQYVGYSDNWTNDPFRGKYESLIPDSQDKIYYIDGPTVGAYATDSFEQNCNFYSYATWKSQACSNTNNFWYFQGKWNANQTPQISNMNVGNGAITLPATSSF